MSILVVTVLYIVAGGTGGNAGKKNRFILFFYATLFPLNLLHSLMYLFLLFTACDFSEENCKAVGALMGRTFKSSSAYSTKGCYLYYIEKYGSDIYYGTGGSEAERNSKLPRFEAKKERPPGFDCKRGLVVFYIKPYQITDPLTNYILIVSMFSLYLSNFS